MTELFAAVSLAEKYRPRSWQAVVGQEPTVKRLKLLQSRGGLAGRAYWLSGNSGTGKSTIARLVGDEIAGEWGMEEIDASEATPAFLARLEERSRLSGPLGGKGGWAYLINEAHGLRGAAIRQLLVMLERIPPHVAWLFTTTSEAQAGLFEDCVDASPLLSRCTYLRLEPARKLIQPFAARAREIAQTEGLDGKPLADYVGLLERCKGNMRAALTEIESGGMLV